MTERVCFSQHGYGVRFEWGVDGLRQLASGTACSVVVDVLSFTTSVTVAVERGTRIHPCRTHDAEAERLAARTGARLAVERSDTTADAPWSLSPAALRRAPFVSRLVLPSPNGATVSATAAEHGAVVVAASLRNAAAVGRWLTAQGYATAGRPVGVIAAGERRADGSLRPAVEDLLGAGAVISALARAGRGILSPEAAAAAAAFQGTSYAGQALAGGASGRELAESGFGEDVAVAAEQGASTVVPVLTEGAFTNAR